MRKIAFFVEGQTEVVFTRKLLENFVGSRNLTIQLAKTYGRKGAETLVETTIGKVGGRSKYFVLIWDSSNDSSVKSDILEQFQGLRESGYRRIIGIRDVYPIPYSQIGKLEFKLNSDLALKPIPTVILLAVMETEAWFLGEFTHFSKYEPVLTPAFIKFRTNIDVENDDIEALPHPSADLDRIYALVGKSYTKELGTVQRVVDLLDFDVLKSGVRKRMLRLEMLYSLLELGFPKHLLLRAIQYVFARRFRR